MSRIILVTIFIALVSIGKTNAEVTSDPMNLLGVLDVSNRFDGVPDPILGAPRDWLAATSGDETVPKQFTVKEALGSTKSNRTGLFISDFLLIETDYEQAHIVVFEKAGDWVQVQAKGDLVWLKMGPRDDFYPYPDLLREGLTFLTVSSLSYSERPDAPPMDIVFNSAMQSSPTNPRYWTPDVEIVDVRFERPNGSVGSADIRKSLLKIRITNQPHCSEPMREGEVVIFEGWIAAYQPDGNASVWFHSRGC